MDTISGEAKWLNHTSKNWSKFAPRSEFFPFKLDIFSQGDWYVGKQTGSHLSCLPYKKIKENLSSVSSHVKFLRSPSKLNINPQSLREFNTNRYT